MEQLNKRLHFFKPLKRYATSYRRGLSVYTSGQISQQQTMMPFSHRLFIRNGCIYYDINHWLVKSCLEALCSVFLWCFDTEHDKQGGCD